MPLDDVEAVVKKVVSKICAQLSQDGEATGITSSSKPAAEVEKFDSKIQVLATARIRRELDIDLPKKRRFFVDREGEALSVAQVAKSIQSIMLAQDKAKKQKVGK